MRSVKDDAFHSVIHHLSAILYILNLSYHSNTILMSIIEISSTIGCLSQACKGLHRNCLFFCPECVGPGFTKHSVFLWDKLTDIFPLEKKKLWENMAVANPSLAMISPLYVLISQACDATGLVVVKVLL